MDRTDAAKAESLEQLVSCPGDNESTDRSAYTRSVEPCAGFTDTRQGNTAYEVTGTAY
jgi:hypothetical protein